MDVGCHEFASFRTSSDSSSLNVIGHPIPNIATLRSKLTEIDHDNDLSLFALRIASQIASVDKPSIRTKPGFVLKYPRSMDAILMYAIAYKASYCDTTMLDVSVSQSTDSGFVGLLPNSVSDSFGSC